MNVHGFIGVFIGFGFAVAFGVFVDVCCDLPLCFALQDHHIVIHNVTVLVTHYTF